MKPHKIKNSLMFEANSSTMKNYFFVLGFVSLLPLSGVTQDLNPDKQYIATAIGFYNFENLFDTIIDPDTLKILQDEFTPHGKNQWNSQRYWEKQSNMAHVVSKLGTEVNPDGVAILGVSEIENRSVLEDFVKQEQVKGRNYQICHHESPDRRGIDVAFIYNPKYFKYISQRAFSVVDTAKLSWKTRDQLLMTGELLGERVHLIVAHWPSRRGGKKSVPSRALAGDVGRQIVDSILTAEPNAKIFYMGDLNDIANWMLPC